MKVPIKSTPQKFQKVALFETTFSSSSEWHVHSDKYPEFKNKYLQPKKRHGHKKAIIAITRKLLVAIYHVLKNDEVYNAELYHYQEFVSPKK